MKEDEHAESLSYEELQKELSTFSLPSEEGEYRELDWECIGIDPDNARPAGHPSLSKRSIGELADTIAEVGLLENLIVKPLGDGKYQLKGGERRWRAIGMLISQGRWDAKRKILCKVVTKGDLETLAENIAREDVYTWQIGPQFVRLIDQGYTQEQIAKSIGMSQTNISICVRIARGLSPKVAEALTRLSASAPPVREILKIADMRDDVTGAPLEEAQLAQFKRLLLEPRKKSNAAPKGSRVHSILSRIRDVQKVRGPMRPVILAVVNYLIGVDDSLELPALEIAKNVPKSRGPLPKSTVKALQKKSKKGRKT